MKKYLYLICLLCCCAFVSNIQVVSAQSSAPYVRVGLLQGVQEVVITANDDFVVKDVDNKVNYKFKKMNEVNIRQKDRTVYVNKKGKETTTLVVAVKNNAPVIVNGKRYRGNLIIQPHKAGLTVINRLLIDEYLYGVVPEEMPASWNIEALKAQAVAARTFALYDKLDRKHTKEGFDVCVTTDCQVYGGMDSEAATTNKAIDATKGEVIVYLNQPICSVFHAASGGQTDDSINVWNVNVPYLRAVEDKEEQSPYQSWAVSVTVDNLSKSIKNSYSDIGTIKEIDFSGLKKNPNKASKPQVVKFIGSNKKSVELTKTQLRSLLGLKSSNFTIELEGNKKAKGDTLKIDKDDILGELKTHLKQYLKSDKKILIEFIKKKTAHDFWVDLQENEDFKDVQIEYLSGDDSIAERKRILDKVKKATDTIILVSTQVIEAGVDIDMDIGYKNISKLDSEEQFLGRINRSCKKEGIAYFFEVDEASDIYKDDVRLSESIVLKDVNMQKILELKLFDEYYKKVLETTMGKYSYHFDEFIKDISDLNYESISTHMKLIDDTQDMVQIYLVRTLCVDGEVLDGKQIWDSYVDLWENGRKTMSYAEWKIELSRIISKMNNFIYQVSKHNLHIGKFYEQMGNIICLEDGDKYFTKDKFNREILYIKN